MREANNFIELIRCSRSFFTRFTVPPNDHANDDDYKELYASNLANLSFVRSSLKVTGLGERHAVHRTWKRRRQGL